MDFHTIGLQIKHARITAGITQKELADKIGTTWEMVSRYETGKSSPLRKIGDIASALHVPVTRLLQEPSVAEPGIPYTANTIPLIQKPFTKVKDALKETKLYYTAPDWIIHTATNPFALDATNVHMQTTHLSPNGILFISQERPVSRKEIVVIQEKDELTALPYSSVAPRATIVGVVKAWEKRLTTT